MLKPRGGSITDIVSSISPVDDGSQGALSSFSYNPIYDVGDQSTGIGATSPTGRSHQLRSGLFNCCGATEQRQGLDSLTEDILLLVN